MDPVFVLLAQKGQRRCNLDVCVCAFVNSVTDYVRLLGLLRRQEDVEKVMAMRFFFFL